MHVQQARQHAMDLKSERSMQHVAAVQRLSTLQASLGGLERARQRLQDVSQQFARHLGAHKPALPGYARDASPGGGCMRGCRYVLGCCCWC